MFRKKPPPGGCTTINQSSWINTSTHFSSAKIAAVNTSKEALTCKYTLFTKYTGWKYINQGWGVRHSSMCDCGSEFCSFLKHQPVRREPSSSCCHSNTHQQSTGHYVMHRTAPCMFSMGQAVNEIISRSKVTVEKINDSWTVRSMTSVWSVECARLYGGMRESSRGEGIGRQR